VECMLGGPDSAVMWDRWEWLRKSAADAADGGSAEDGIAWNDPKRLIPH